MNRTSAGGRVRLSERGFLGDMFQLTRCKCKA